MGEGPLLIDLTLGISLSLMFAGLTVVLLMLLMFLSDFL